MLSLLQSFQHTGASGEETIGVETAWMAASTLARSWKLSCVSGMLMISETESMLANAHGRSGRIDGLEERGLQQKLPH